MSEKEVSSDEGDVPLKQAFNDGRVEKKSPAKKGKKPSKKESTPTEKSDKTENNEESAPAKENKKSQRNRSKKKFYVEVDEEDFSKAVPLLDQPVVVEGSRQRKAVMSLNAKSDVPKPGAIPIPPGKGVSLGRIPNVSSRIKRFRLDEIKILHRLLFGKLGNVSYLNSNILKFNGFTFTKDSSEYTKKLTALGKLNTSILREFLFFCDLDLKIRKKEDVVKAVLEFLLCPKRAEVTVNPNIVSHPKRKATKRNYYERDIEEDRRPRKAKPSKTKESETSEASGEASEADTSASKGKEKESKTEDEESKENDAGADNTNELKKPAKKRKRNQVIEEQPEAVEENRSKKSKSKESTNSNVANESDIEVSDAENLTDDELKNFLKKVLADANLETTTMKTVYSLISKHYPNYNFTKKKDFIKEVVKSAIQT